MKLLEKLASGEVYFIAEMSGNHGGSLSKALDIVRAAAQAGADCLKIQTFTPDTITLNCDKPDFLTRKGLWEGRTLYDLYQEAYTPWEWQNEIKLECEKQGLDFLSSVFDDTAVDFMESIGASAYKIASPELVDVPLIEYAASKGRPMIMSCGMADEGEIVAAVDACVRSGNENIVLLKCTSEYPAVYEDMNLATIPDMASRFGYPVGLSDHSLGDAAAVAAATLGALVIEKHFCLSREFETVDSQFSMEPHEFAQMVESVKRAKAAVGRATYDRTPREEAMLFGRRSVYASANIFPGEEFTPENVKIVRPAMGLAPHLWKHLIGRRATRTIEFGDRIRTDDLGPGEIALRSIAVGDKERTFVWVTNPWYMNEFAGRAKPTRESNEAFFDMTAKDGTQKYFAVDCDGVYIGNAGLKHIDEEECECWYYIGEKSYRGRGLSKKIVSCLLNEAKLLDGVVSVEAKVLQSNVKSAKALLANGFVHSDTERHPVKKEPLLVYRKKI